MGEAYIKGKSKEEILAQLDSIAEPGSVTHEQQKMAIIVRCTQDLEKSLNEAERNIGLRLNGLTEALDKARCELHESSEAATRQTNALVRWTRWLVVATIGVAFLTGGLVYVSDKQLEVAKLSMQAQIEPEIRLPENPPRFF